MVKVWSEIPVNNFYNQEFKIDFICVLNNSGFVANYLQLHVCNTNKVVLTD